MCINMNGSVPVRLERFEVLFGSINFEPFSRTSQLKYKLLPITVRFAIYAYMFVRRSAFIVQY